MTTRTLMDEWWVKDDEDDEGRPGGPAGPLSAYGRDFVFGPWIEWAGGERPVPEHERPEVRYRSGGTTEAQANSLRWDHADKWDDVMAYRVRRPVMPGLAP